ncbi:hypothetical protein NQ623_17905 [Acinetobacter baumannii]|jgi:hypothetical protein|nr:hypothetical protein [Acinetobacter baumannii]
MKLLKKISENFLYSNEQIGLVFLLLFIGLLLLPSSIYGMVFYTSMTPEEVNFYSKYGAIFTAIGAVFTIINTFIVIYLMVFFHKKEVDISIFPYVTELKRVLVDIELVIRSELDYFDDKQFEAYQNLDESRYQGSGFHFYGYDHVYRQEITNLNKIILEVKDLYSEFSVFKLKVNDQTDINLNIYKEKINIVNKLNEILTLKKPSSEYKKSFIDGNKTDEDPEDMIEKAKTDSLAAISDLKTILSESK